MEWNWCWHGNDVSPFMLCESSGDSEEVKSNIHHHHHHDYNYHEATMDDLSFLLDDKEDIDDDAQSCSYDHSSYINTSYGNSHIDQSQKLTYDDHDMDDDNDVVDDDDDGDNKMINKNWGESKLLMDSSKQQKRSHKCCGDSLSQREIDKQFWETCLAS